MNTRNFAQRTLILLGDGLFIDSFVVDDKDNVIFMSLWGRDGQMQHFFAALTLPIAQGGFREKRVTLPDGSGCTLGFDRIKDMKKHTTRLPKYTPVGEWVQTWLMIPDFVKTPHGSHEAYLLSQHSLNWQALWPIVKRLCHLPLLDEWQAPLASMLGDAPYVQSLDACGVFAYKVILTPDLIEPLLSQAVKSGELTVPVMPSLSRATDSGVTDSGLPSSFITALH